MPARPAAADADVPAASQPVPMAPRQASEGRRWIPVTLVLFLVGAVLSGGAFVYLRGQQQARQADRELQRQQQAEIAHAAEVQRLAELAEQRKAEAARLAELQQQRADAEAAVREADLRQRRADVETAREAERVPDSPFKKTREIDGFIVYSGSATLSGQYEREYSSTLLA